MNKCVSGWEHLVIAHSCRVIVLFTL